MKKPSSFTLMRRAFTAGVLLLAGCFLAFVGYMYITYDGILTGNVEVELSPDLLANLQTRRFEEAVLRMETRASLPDVPAGLPDPYDAPAP